MFGPTVFEVTDSRSIPRLHLIPAAGWIVPLNLALTTRLGPLSGRLAEARRDAQRSVTARSAPEQPLRAATPDDFRNRTWSYLEPASRM